MGRSSAGGRYPINLGLVLRFKEARRVARSPSWVRFSFWWKSPPGQAPPRSRGPFQNVLSGRASTPQGGRTRCVSTGALPFSRANPCCVTPKCLSPVLGHPLSTPGEIVSEQQTLPAVSDLIAIGHMPDLLAPGGLVHLPSEAT